MFKTLMFRLDPDSDPTKSGSVSKSDHTSKPDPGPHPTSFQKTGPWFQVLFITDPDDVLIPGSGFMNAELFIKHRI